MQNDKPFIIVGLGNPGPRYKQTLHNVGFKIVEKLAEKHSLTWKYESRFQAEVAKTEQFHLIRPETFMNLSGEAVKAYLKYFELKAEQVVVVADDADLLQGEIRLKPFGGSGGHNGLKSIAKELSTQNFKRLRFGIGRPTNVHLSLADFVLMDLPLKFWEELDLSLEKAANLLDRLANETFDEVMKAANT